MIDLYKAFMIYGWIAKIILNLLHDIMLIRDLYSTEEETKNMNLVLLRDGLACIF